MRTDPNSMKGFVLAHGRSGTAWVATALRECCGIDARHEAMGRRLGAGYGGVEVNGFLRDQVPAIRERFPGAVLVHLVRDGRDVVRSVMSRHPLPLPFERRCARWAYLNRRLMAEIPPGRRFRLEDLTRYGGSFEALGNLFGAGRVDWDRWDACRGRTVNATESHDFPPFSEWSSLQVMQFWTQAGGTMAELGYVS